MVMKSFLTRPLARVRSTLARSTTASRVAARMRDQLHGVVVEHLGHDIDMTRNGERWIIQQLGTECRTFIDVGANVGDWTAAFLEVQPSANGWLVEPSETAASRLDARFGADPRVRVERAVASDHAGTVTFYEEPAAGHTSSVVPGFSSHATARRVRATTVDELVSDQRIAHVDYLKIDAEGHDLHVLRGASETLRGGRVRAVQFEYNLPWRRTGSSLADAYALLAGLGYETFLLKGPRLYRLPYHVYGEFFHYANFIALPQPYVSAVQHLVGGSI